jgi:hypothetical protein
MTQLDLPLRLVEPDYQGTPLPEEEVQHLMQWPDGQWYCIPGVQAKPGQYFRLNGSRVFVVASAHSCHRPGRLLVVPAPPEAP